MNLISSKIAKNMDLLNFFANIALRPVIIIITLRCNNSLLRNINSHFCHVVGTKQVTISSVAAFDVLTSDLMFLKNVRCGNKFDVDWTVGFVSHNSSSFGMKIS